MRTSRITFLLFCNVWSCHVSIVFAVTVKQFVPLTHWATMCPTYFFTCLTPDNFTCQWGSSAAQLVEAVGIPQRWWLRAREWWNQSLSLLWSTLNRGGVGGGGQAPHWLKQNMKTWSYLKEWSLFTSPNQNRLTMIHCLTMSCLHLNHFHLKMLLLFPDHLLTIDDLWW